MSIKNLTLKYTQTEIEEKIKKVCVNMLEKFADICDTYGLKFWLDGGTLLGAARDGKFIPWDDDIDVIMPRDDYDRLIEMGQVVTNLFGKYFFQTSYTDTCFEVHAKLRDPNTCALTEREFAGRHNRGMFLDIFPLDNCPDLLIAREDVAGFVKTLAKHTGAERNFTHHSMQFNILNRVLRDVGEQYAHSELVANMAFWRYDKDLNWFYKRDYEKTVYLEFEGRKYPVPAGYEHVLDVWYTDSWRTPQNRPNCHKAFVDPFNSYKRYDKCTKEDFKMLTK